jgi:hypothetical protein
MCIECCAAAALHVNRPTKDLQHSQFSLARRPRPARCQHQRYARYLCASSLSNVYEQRLCASECFDGLVVIARGKAPDPIPNSVVKTLCADGTTS